MARPRLSDDNVERFQMVIPQSEIEEIDDWRHSKKIASKSEAVRRLCRIGLAFSAEQHAIYRRVERALKATTKIVADFQKDRPTQPAELNRIRKRMAAGLLVVLEEQTAAYRALLEARVELHLMNARGSTDYLIAVAEQLKTGLVEEAEQ